MATVCLFDKQRKIIRIFGSSDYWEVTKIEEGYVIIEPWIFMDIYKVAEAVAGCFEEESNFIGTVKKYFNFEGEFKGIKFEFNGIWITVTEEKADADKIVKEYYEKLGD